MGFTDNSISTVSSASVLDLADACISFDLLDKAKLAEFGIYYSELGDFEQRIPEARLVSLWLFIAENADPEHFGLLIGQQINPSAKGLLASWVSQCDTIGEAFNVFQKNIPLMNPSERWTLDEQGDSATLSFYLKQDSGYPSIVIERSMSAMVAWGRILSGAAFHVRRASFQFEEPHYRSEFEAIFGKNIYFGASENQIVIEAKQLMLPVTSANRYLKDVMGAKAKETLTSLAKGETVASQVKTFIESNLSEHKATIEGVCESLAISRQTLYRRLKQENTDFKTLLESVRKEQVIKLLSKEKSITTISLSLGFKETSSFYKAFQRWFGCSPKDYTTRNHS